MKLIAFFLSGFLLVGGLNVCVVLASRSLKFNIAWIAGTSLGAILGIYLGGRLTGA